MLHNFGLSNYNKYLRPILIHLTILSDTILKHQLHNIYLKNDSTTNNNFYILSNITILNSKQKNSKSNEIRKTLSFNHFCMVGAGGFEPPKSSDNRFTVCSIWPLWKAPINKGPKALLKMELAKGIEPSTC